MGGEATAAGIDGIAAGAAEDAAVQAAIASSLADAELAVSQQHDGETLVTLRIPALPNPDPGAEYSREQGLRIA